MASLRCLAGLFGLLETSHGNTMITIHDGNWAEFAHQAQSVDGLCSALPRESQIGSLPYARPYAEVIELIPPSQYAERYEAMLGKFAYYQKAVYTPGQHNQRNHPLCWGYSLAQHLECVLAKMRRPYVQLAPESLLGCNGYNDIGWFLDKALEWASQYGMAPRSMVPQYAINPKLWDERYKQEALKYIPFERYDLGTKNMYDECMTALLSGDAVYVGYRWLRHAMDIESLQKQGNEYGFWTPNTWGEGNEMLLFGQKKIPDEAYVVRAMNYV